MVSGNLNVDGPHTAKGHAVRQNIWFFFSFPILVIVILTGCGRVAGNYPDSRVQVSALPDEFKSPRGHDTVLRWNAPGKVHGFLSMFRDTGERAEAFRMLAGQSNLDVHREGAVMFQKMSDEGIAEIVMFVFFARDVAVTCKTGDFEIAFTDGSTVGDLGVLRYEPRDTTKPYRITKEGPVKLSGEPVGKEKPLPVSIFVSAENLGKVVESIRFTKEI